MSTGTNLQDTIHECHSASTREERLVAMVSDDRLMVRANAVIALARRKVENEASVVAALMMVARTNSAKSIVFGTVSEVILAAMALKSIASPEALKAFASIQAALTPTEREQLLWNLQNNTLPAIAEINQPVAGKFPPIWK
jgi:hypothetical protein